MPVLGSTALIAFGVTHATGHAPLPRNRPLFRQIVPALETLDPLDGLDPLAHTVTEQLREATAQA